MRRDAFYTLPEAMDWRLFKSIPILDPLHSLTSQARDHHWKLRRWWLIFNCFCNPRTVSVAWDLEPQISARSLHSTGAKRASERTFGGHEVLLLGNLNRYEFRDALGICQRVDDVLGGQFAHDQCQIAFERGLDRASINPLHVFRDASTTNHFHDKFCILHSLLCCLEVLLRRSRCTDEKG